MSKRLHWLRRCLLQALFVAGFICGASLTAWAQTDELPQQIQIAGLDVALPQNANKWLDSFSKHATKPVQALMQWQRLPDARQQQEAATSGITILRYAGASTYIVSIEPRKGYTVSGVRSIVPIKASWKIAGILLPHTASAEQVDLVFSCIPGISRTDIEEQIASLGGELKKGPLNDHGFYEANLSGLKIAAFASWYGVKSIGLASKDVPLNRESQWITKATVARAPVSAGGYNLLGDSITVGVGDNTSGLYHVDTRDRVVNFNYAYYSNHGQHVNGTVGGAGIMDLHGEGFAPHVRLVDHLYTNVWTRTGPMLHGYNMSVTNNSYAARAAPNDSVYCAYAGTYDDLAELLDSVALKYPSVLHVFAAGNNGPSTCPPYPQGYFTIAGGYQPAKNIIVVANATKQLLAYAGSSRGPVRDGRIRPDITALGTAVYSTQGIQGYLAANGTSMASPEIAAGAGLTQQAYKRRNGGVYPTSLLTKTLLMNGAMDIGARGPDFTYGYGVMDMQRTLKMIDSSWHTAGSIADGANQTPVTINVPSGTAQLKVMLGWHDVPASPLASTQLVNDLDLKVNGPGGAVFLPYVLNSTAANVKDTATTGVDHKNNMEQVVIDNPVAGPYTVDVSGFSVPSGPQAYVVAYDMIPTGILLGSPATGDVYRNAFPIVVTWDAGPSVNTFTIEFSSNNGGSWLTISTSVPARDRQLIWTPPAGTSSAQCLIRVTRNGTGETTTSGLFAVNNQPTISLMPYQCPGYVNLKWTSIPNATSYSILRKVGYYMQAVGSTTDTFYYASGLNPDSMYYFAVQPAFGTAKGYRSVGISRKPDTGSCTGSFSDNDLRIDKVLSPITGRIGTSTALTNNDTLTLLVRNLDDAATGSYRISCQLNGGAWQTQTLSSFPANSSAVVSFTGLNMAAAGTYTIRAAIQNLSSADPVTSNDTIVKVVRQLQNNVVNLLASSITEGFESTPLTTTTVDSFGFTPDERWDFVNSYDSGRLRTFVDSEITITGDRSLSMDLLYQTGMASPFNQLIGTFNMSSYGSSNEIRLEFDYKVHGKPKYRDSNKVFLRGSDANTWLPVFSYDTSRPVGRLLQSGSLSVTDILNAASQSFSSSSQILFGQRDTAVIAANDEGNGLTIDNIRLYLVGKDIALTAVTSPSAVNCALGTTTPLTITVYNGVTTTANNIGLHYQLDSGPIVNESLSSLAGKTSTPFTFSTNLGALSLGVHVVKIWAALSGDDVPSNDTIVYTFRNEPLISSYPYLENFESGDGYWWSEGTKNTWAYGTPNSASIKKAASGTKAWKTNLTGYHNDRELSYLYSPCFDIGSLTYPMLSFSLSMEIENCDDVLCDGAWVEYSTNNGSSWSKLGARGQGTNWYSYESAELWNVQSPVRWKVASIPLAATAQTIRFRFVFSSDEGASFDGIAVDDIHVFDKANAIYSGGSVGPVTNTVSGSGYTSFVSGGGLLAEISAASSGSLGMTDVKLYAHSNLSNPSSQQYFFPRNFVVNTHNTPTDTVTARLYITDAEFVTLMNATGCAGCSKPEDAYELGITKYDNSNTSVEDSTLSNNIGGTTEYIPHSRIKWVPYDAGYYAQFSVTSFSELWFNDGGAGNAFPLPIAGLEFDARKSSETGVLATWLSHVDTQVRNYELERSIDARNWSVVATIPAVGNNTHQYSHTDQPNTATAKAFYYRLKYTLFTGKQYYSSIRQVIWSGRGATLSVYPNPTSDGLLRLDWNTQPGSMLDAVVTDVSGRRLLRVSNAANDYSNTTTLDLSSVARGVYFLHVTIGGERFEVKFVRQ